MLNIAIDRIILRPPPTEAYYSGPTIPPHQHHLILTTLTPGIQEGHSDLVGVSPPWRRKVMVTRGLHNILNPELILDNVDATPRRSFHAVPSSTWTLQGH